MTRLPNVTARQLLRALLGAGFFEEGQRGSHLMLRHLVRHTRTVVPVRPGDLHRKLLKAILKQAGLSEEEFRELL